MRFYVFAGMPANWDCTCAWSLALSMSCIAANTNRNTSTVVHGKFTTCGKEQESPSQDLEDEKYQEHFVNEVYCENIIVDNHCKPETGSEEC